MPRSLAGELAAVKAYIAQADHTGFSSQLEHLHEQLGQKLQVPLAEIADRAEIGAIIADDGQEGEIPLAGLGDLAAGIDTDAVGVEQQTDEHGGFEGWLAARLHFVGGVEGVQVELGYDIQEEEDEIVFGKPVSWAEGLLGISLGVPGAVLLATWDDHDESSRHEDRQDPAHTKNTSAQLQMPAADRINDKPNADNLLGRLDGLERPSYIPAARLESAARRRHVRA